MTAKNTSVPQLNEEKLNQLVDDLRKDVHKMQLKLEPAFLSTVFINANEEVCKNIYTSYTTKLIYLDALRNSIRMAEEVLSQLNLLCKNVKPNNGSC